MARSKTALASNRNRAKDSAKGTDKKSDKQINTKGKVRKRDLDASCQAILDGAERCFIEKGFDGASMSVIAKQAGVTQSLIHYHYNNKENLWNEVKRRRLNSCFAQQKELLNQPADEKTITRIITIYFRTFQENPGLSRLLGWKTLDDAGDRLVERQEEAMEREVTQLAVKRISEAQEKGIIRNDLNPSYIVVSMFALVAHWFNAKGRYFVRPELDIWPDNADEDYLNSIIHIVLQGILKEKNHRK